MEPEAVMGCSVLFFCIVGACLSGILGIIFKGFLAGFGIAVLSLPIFLLIGVFFGFMLVVIIGGFQR